MVSGLQSRHGPTDRTALGDSRILGGAVNTEPITFAEYEAAYRRFVRCLNKTGVEIIEYGLDPHTQLFEFATEAGDPEVERATGRIPADDCYDLEFADVDERWQIQQAAPLAEEDFERARRFFEARGVSDIPEEAVATLNIGVLLQHAASTLGEGSLREFSQAESRRERALRAPAARLIAVCLDCDDADVLANFYTALCGWRVVDRDGQGWVQLRDPDSGFKLNVQSMVGYEPPIWPEEPGRQQKMLHFELEVDNLESTILLALELGAKEADHQPPDRDPSRIRVMLDPSGHPFCLFMAGE